MLFAYLCWQFVSWALYFNRSWAKAVRMKNFLSQSNEAIKLLGKVLFTPWHIIVFVKWGFWPLSWRMETFQWIGALAWVSELNIGLWHGSISFLVSLKPLIINECGVLVVGKIKSWEKPTTCHRYRHFFSDVSCYWTQLNSIFHCF